MTAELGQHQDVCLNEVANVARNSLFDKGALTLLPLPQISDKEGMVEVCCPVCLSNRLLQLADNHRAGCRKGPSQSE